MADPGYIREADTVAAQSYSSLLFRKKATDVRFTTTDVMELPSTTSIANGDTALFNIPAIRDGRVYFPNKIYLKLSIKIAKEDGTPVGPSKWVAPVNNVMHSCIKSCTVKIMQQAINSNNENYGYKAYMLDTLGTEQSAKYSWMQGFGYHEDTANAFDNPVEGTHVFNLGFEERRRPFRNFANNAYHGEPVEYYGRLHHDLEDYQGGIIWGLPIEVELKFQDSNFVLQTNDATQYKYTVTDVRLYIKSAHLTDSAFNHISRTFGTKDDDNNQVNIYYTKQQICTKQIPQGVTLWTSEPLFATTQLPSRIVLGFVKTAAFLGNQRNNPYFFLRRFAEGKYIKRVAMALNGIEQGTNTVAGERNDPAMFGRLAEHLGLDGTFYGNSINFAEFHGGFYFCGFDLSTSGDSAPTFVTPAVKTGILNLRIEFSAALPEDLTCVMLCSFPSLLKINSKLAISMSYV